jgi:hypothetical protein
LNPAAGIPEAPKRTPEPFDYNNRAPRVSNFPVAEIICQSQVFTNQNHAFAVVESCVRDITYNRADSLPKQLF